VLVSYFVLRISDFQFLPFSEGPMFIAVLRSLALLRYYLGPTGPATFAEPVRLSTRYYTKPQFTNQ
jgi:hypothetical protein